MVNKNMEKKLAHISEEENYNKKNRYRLQRTQLDFADKKRMPIDESKLKDVLKNRPTFKIAIENEIGTYDVNKKNPQFENGILTFLNESSYGEMRELIRDVGIHADNMEFFNVGDLQKKREQLFKQDSDHNYHYLMNALFTPLDMTDYENQFVGFDEIGGALPISNPHILMNNPNIVEDPPTPDFTNRKDEPMEKRNVSARSIRHRNQLEDADSMKEYMKNMAEEEEDEEDDEAEAEEGEEEEEDKLAAYLAKEDAYPAMEQIEHHQYEDKYFMHGENLRNKFNEIELD